MGKDDEKPLPSQQTKLPYGNINHVSITKIYQTLTYMRRIMSEPANPKNQKDSFTVTVIHMI
jgi:hypothetical protein